jgi:hypothetical protein
MLPRQRGDSSVNDSPLSATILLRLQIENNNRHLRGKKRAIEGIVQHVLPIYGETRHLRHNEYQMKIAYRTDADLDKIMDELLREITWEADLRNCFSESEARSSKARIGPGESRARGYGVSWSKDRMFFNTEGKSSLIVSQTISQTTLK